ncbi:MAG: hypothetical protein U5K00_23290 [Melioribacteraceae bacterium]|nr:hypothetical protein [Melioribacteraceae bacterium]
MNNLVKIFLLIIIAISLQAQSSVTTMFYHLPISYKDSGVRENSSLTGVYAAWEADLNNTFEFAADYSDLNYIFDFQTLINMILHLLTQTNSIPDWKFRAGGHYINFRRCFNRSKLTFSLPASVNTDSEVGMPTLMFTILITATTLLRLTQFNCHPILD